MGSTDPHRQIEATANQSSPPSRQAGHAVTGSPTIFPMQTPVDRSPEEPPQGFWGTLSKGKSESPIRNPKFGIFWLFQVLSILIIPAGASTAPRAARRHGPHQECAWKSSKPTSSAADQASPLRKTLKQLPTGIHVTPVNLRDPVNTS